MSVTAVIGAQWGDEGKAKIVDVLAKNADVVVRANGGRNAGHTVVLDEDTFITHEIPSGFLYPRTQLVMGSGMVIYPPATTAEIDRIEQAGYSLEERLGISGKAHLVLPTHIIEDAFREKDRSSPIGTTKKGIGPTYSQKARRTSVRARDILDEKAFRARILKESYRLSLKYRWSDVKGLFVSGEEFRSFYELSRYYIECALLLAPYICDTEELLWRAIEEKKRILLEGAQGVLLDIDHGTYPFVTSSATGIAGLAQGSGIPATKITRRIGVVKAYTTRVGAGPFPTEMNESTAETIREKGNEYGSTTGRPRRCGWLDLALLRYASQLNDFTDIAVTKVDVLANMKSLLVRSQYDRASYMGNQVVYERMTGWGSLPDNIESISEFPLLLRLYVDCISNAAAAPVSMVSVGPARNEMVYL